MKIKRTLQVRIDRFTGNYRIIKATNILSPQVGEWVTAEQAEKMIQEGIQIIVVK